MIEDALEIGPARIREMINYLERWVVLGLIVDLLMPETGNDS